MRIVAGSARGTSLAGPQTDAIRPTSDRLRETLFNILAHRFGDPVTGARVLDLFAGTGALGLEALSRGGRFALFVDTAAAARGLVRENAERTRTTGRTRIWRRDARKLGPLSGTEPFTLLFADPPYGRGLGEAALQGAVAGGWLVPGGIAVLEERADVAVPEIAGLSLVDRREAGESALHFYEVAGAPAQAA